MPQQTAKIGKNTAENGLMRAAKYFTATWGIHMNQFTVRRLKLEYLKKLKEVVSEIKSIVGEELTSNEITVNTIEIKRKASLYYLMQI